MIEFVDPPVGGPGSPSLDYEQIAKELRERPQEWAIVARQEPGTTGDKLRAISGRINRGALKDLRSGFEAKTRTLEGVVTLFARFAPEDES